MKRAPRDLSRLFRDVDEPPPFKDELASLANGAKPLSMFSVEADSEQAIRASSWFKSMTANASRRGLRHRLEVASVRGGSEGTLYLFRAAEAWRCKALSLLIESHRGRYWSDAAELMMSSLLGYPAESAERVVANHALCSAGWGLRTFYLLVPSRHGQRLAQGPRRGLPARLPRGSTLFAMSQPLAPRHPWPSMTHALARFGTRQACLAELVRKELVLQGRSARNAIWTVSDIPRALPVLEQYMKSDLQIWSDGAWK